MQASPSGSTFLNASFIILTLIVAAGIIWHVYLAGRGLQEARRRTYLFTAVAAVGISVWMALTWFIASTGALAQFDQRPAPLLWLIVAVLVLSGTLAFTRYGTRFVAGLPMWMLVAGQAFRLPLELLMHVAAAEGVMPPQMSYTGWNFDIVTGATALPVAWWLARGYRSGRMVAMIWNVLGAALLANILVIALLSMPMVAAFGPDRLNTWVAYPPYVWLPTVMVVTALTGHLVMFRKLRATARRRL